MANGFVFTQGLSPQQSTAPAQRTQDVAQGTPQAIMASATLLENKKREAQRQYERAQTMMRQDLNTVGGFDVSAAGTGQLGRGIQQLAEYTREEIKKANDPIKAQELINNFRSEYNMAKEREASIADKEAFQTDLSKATGADLDALNAGLDMNSEYVVPSTADLAAARSKWDNPYAGDIQIVDGKMMAIDPKDGKLKALADIESTLDSTMFDPSKQMIQTGALRDWARGSDTKTDIAFTNGKWSGRRAGEIFDENIMQTGRKSDKTKTGEYHRRQVLNTLEDTGKIGIFDLDERQDFVLGNFDNINQDKLNRVLELGRKEFIRLSYFEAPTQEDTSGAGYGVRGVYRSGDGKLVTATGKTDEVVGSLPDDPATDPTFTGPAEEGVEIYDMIPVVDGRTGKDAAITVDASRYVQGGNYGIYAGGVSPTSGRFSIRYAYEGQLPQYKFMTDDNVTVITADPQEIAELRNDPRFVTEEQTGKTVKGDVVKTEYLPEDPDDYTGLQQEMINNIMNLNPSLYNTMTELQQQYTKTQLDTFMSQDAANQSQTN